MRPEEFSQMLRNRPGSLANRGVADAAKDRLRESFERYSSERRERQERLQMDRAVEASRIWVEASSEIASKSEGEAQDA